MITRGFVLGKFLPPHGGHVALCRAAEAMCDQLTILVCWLPDDPIPGEQRLHWMRELFPKSRVVGHDKVVPQYPHESADFWPIWRAIVSDAHPEAIDMLFAGEDYGAELAAQVGGKFVPLGGRIIQEDMAGLGGLAGSQILQDPAKHWQHLPVPVRRDMGKSVVLHGIESTGKSTLAAALAERLGTCWVPEYGRSHCVVHGTDLGPADLTLIASAQQAMIRAAREWSGAVLPCDTDWLMTAAWNRMLFGEPMGGERYPLADLYLHLAPDTAFVDDGLRMFGAPDERRKFDALCREELEAAGASWVEISGPWDTRLEQALTAIERLG